MSCSSQASLFFFYLPFPSPTPPNKTHNKPICFTKKIKTVLLLLFDCQCSLYTYVKTEVCGLLLFAMMTFLPQP